MSERIVSVECAFPPELHTNLVRFAANPSNQCSEQEIFTDCINEAIQLYWSKIQDIQTRVANRRN